MGEERSDRAQPVRGLERAVMEAVWDLDEATGREVLEHVNAQSARDRAYTTVATTLIRLERKGDLARVRRGRADVFRALSGRREWLDQRAETAVDDLLENYGDVALAHFARHVESLDADRLTALRRLAESE